MFLRLKISSPWTTRHQRASQLNDVMNFVTPFARRGKAGEDHPDHAFLDENGVTDFELRFVGAPYEGLACRFLHFSIVAHHN